MRKRFQVPETPFSNVGSLSTRMCAISQAIENEIMALHNPIVCWGGFKSFFSFLLAAVGLGVGRYFECAGIAEPAHQELRSGKQIVAWHAAVAGRLIASFLSIFAQWLIEVIWS